MGSFCAVAKAYGHVITVDHRESCGLFGCSGMLLNRESLRERSLFVARKSTRGVARIKFGLAELSQKSADDGTPTVLPLRHAVLHAESIKLYPEDTPPGEQKKCAE